MTATEKQIINTIFHSLETYALGDIKFLQQNGKPIAAFILCTCFIEQVSHFVYGPGGRSSDKSIDFITEYLNKGKSVRYSANDLVEILRNKLVHNYSLSDRKNPKLNKYSLNYDNPKTHLHKENGMTYINIDSFITDIETALHLYKEEVKNNAELVQKAMSQYNRFGILVHREEKISI